VLTFFGLGRVLTFFGLGGGPGEFFRCGRPHFLVQKLWIFRNLWCPHWQGVVEPVWTRVGGIWDQFLRFCAESFMDGP